MKLSTTGLTLIKSFEGCRLTAYKAVATEKYLTIGYGHYGADVSEGMKITQEKAEALLISDTSKAVNTVNKLIAYYPTLNQNQFDALVSFTYNCGTSNLNKLTAKNTRTLSEISKAITSYNKSGGKVLNGLTRRRNAEQKLFNTPVANVLPVVAKPTLKQGMNGTQVKYLQEDLNYLLNAGLICDGVFGANTKKWVIQFQKKNKISADGIYGGTSYKFMLSLIN